MAESPGQQAHRPVVDEQFLPTGLLPCFHCGFDLRGSATEGRCPECGHHYRRDLQYQDVARQKLRVIRDDVLFIFLAALMLDAVAVAVISATMFMPTPAWLILVPFLGFIYLLLLLLYGSCWFKLLWALYHRRTLLWGQIRGVGLSTILVKAGIALAVPSLILIWSFP